MRRIVCLAQKWVAVLLVALAFCACSIIPGAKSQSTPTSPLASQTGVPIATTPLLSANETPSPSAAVTETALPTGIATATNPIPAAGQRTTPTLAIPPGIYVTAIKIEPAEARSDQAPVFTATFLNTTGQVQTYRWFVKIYTPDQPQSFGETPKVDSAIPSGTAQLKAAPEWKTRTFFGCLWFVARVFWVDQDNRVIEFLKPNGTSPATGFAVCP